MHEGIFLDKVHHNQQLHTKRKGSHGFTKVYIDTNFKTWKVREPLSSYITRGSSTGTAVEALNETVKATCVLHVELSSPAEEVLEILEELCSQLGLLLQAS